MDFSFLTENNIINAGGITVALVSMFLVFYVVKKFIKVLSNHLHDQHEDNLKRNESDKLLAGAISKMSEKIDNFK